MVDYQKMYYILCRAASEALDELPDITETEVARKILQDALTDAEELYITAQDE